MKNTISTERKAGAARRRLLRAAKDRDAAECEKVDASALRSKCVSWRVGSPSGAVRLDADA